MRKLFIVQWFRIDVINVGTIQVVPDLLLAKDEEEAKEIAAANPPDDETGGWDKDGIRWAGPRWEVIDILATEIPIDNVRELLRKVDADA